MFNNKAFQEASGIIVNGHHMKYVNNEIVNAQNNLQPPLSL